MELHPILEKDTCPNSKLWYVLSALGECPSVRVGHTCSYISGSEGHTGKLFVIGGANPDGSFAETYVLDLATFSWDTCEAPGFKARYEHSAFVPQSQPNKIYVFGGAAQSCNFNDIQVLDTSCNAWSSPTVGGTPPSPRTYHTMAAAGDQFIVYSGGQSQADPVGDRQVHCFNAAELTWSTLNIRGDAPKPRHGHVVVAIGNKVYIHGGMSGMTFYDDLHVLDLDKKSWTSIKKKKGQPSARAAHGGFALGSDLYVFGGISRDGALDDLYKLNTVSMTWNHVEMEGPPPARRLDLAMCCIRLAIPLSSSSDSVEDVLASGQQARDTLDQQLRLGSAGSIRSLGSAGSQRSAASVGSTGSAFDRPTEQNKEAPPSSDPGSPQHQPVVNGKDSPSSCEGADAASAAPISTEVKVVDMCLVFGGMDTEGEIFDDCLVTLLNDI